MSLQEIERSVVQLTPEELAQFAEWFAKYHADTWDEQIERDAKAGRFDALIEQAQQEFEAGHYTKL